jgi:hypothetical protein
MTAAFSARRRADEFEALLSRGPDTPLTERDADRFAVLLDLVEDLRSVPQVAPRPEFVSSLRESLMAEADTVLLRQPATPPRLAMPVASRRRDRRVAAVLGGAALVGATATMAVAAQTSLPGEALYGVKRGIESAEVRLATDDAARGRVLLDQAGTRLTELEVLAAGDGDREQLIADTLDAFTEQAGEGVRSLLTAYDQNGVERDAQLARDFAAQSLERLDALEDDLPDSARDELLAAGRTLTDLDLEVSSACQACQGGITTTPDFLLANAPPTDLLTGLDADEQTLEAAPISGQDLTGITVPEQLDPQVVPPSVSPTTGSSLDPTEAVPTATSTTKPDPTEPVKDVTEDVTDTSSDVASQLNGVTGGALGGLTGDVDNATGGLITEVTGTLDGVTDGTTGGLLP